MTWNYDTQPAPLFWVVKLILLTPNLHQTWICWVTICPILAGTVSDFRGGSQPAVGTYNGYVWNTGAWGSVWMGVEVVQSTLQAHSRAATILWECVLCRGRGQGAGSVLDFLDDVTDFRDFHMVSLWICPLRHEAPFPTILHCHLHPCIIGFYTTS